MTTDDAAKLLGIHRSRVHHLIHNVDKGFDPAKLNGTKRGRDWWIETDELERFAAIPRPVGWQKGRKRK